MVKRIFAICLVTLSAYALYELPWIVPRTLWFVLHLPAPPASAWHTVAVHNDTPYDLIINVDSVNDLSFVSYGGWFERQREHVGWRRDLERLVPAGAKTIMSLPSESDPRMSLLLVTARSEMTSASLRQHIGLFLLTWPWEDGAWKWRDKESPTGWPVIDLHIESQDLTLLDLDQLGRLGGDSLKATAIPLIRK